MKFLSFFLLTLIVAASPAFAERLEFDHRLYPPLKAVFDQDKNEMIAYDNSNPKYVIDRIVTQGKSVSNWNEALDIIARSPSAKVKTVDQWYEEIRAKSGSSCPSQFSIIARNDNSITFSRRSTKCAKDKVQFALYRIVAGKRTMFLLNPTQRGDMAEAAQKQWLELLASARLKD
jgi:hypothetical protein